MHRFDCLDGVVTMSSRRLKTEFSSKLVEKSVRRSFPNPHRAIALHVAMAAHRAEAGSGFSYLTAQQHQVHNFLNVGHRVLVLRQSHGPTKDRSVRLDKDRRRFT